MTRTTSWTACLLQLLERQRRWLDDELAPEQERDERIEHWARRDGCEYESSGVQLNLVPREGANRFSLSGDATYMNENFQGSNLTDKIRQRNLNAVGHSKRIWDYGATAGGPIKPDKLWFIAAPQWWGVQNTNAGGFYNATQHTPFYTPELQPPRAHETLVQRLRRAADVAGDRQGQDCRVAQLAGRVRLYVPGHPDAGARVPGSLSLQASRVAVELEPAAEQQTALAGRLLLRQVPAEHDPRRRCLPTDISTIDAGTGQLYGAPATPNFSSTSSGNYQTGTNQSDQPPVLPPPTSRDRTH